MDEISMLEGSSFLSNFGLAAHLWSIMHSLLVVLV